MMMMTTVIPASILPHSIEISPLEISIHVFIRNDADTAIIFSPNGHSGNPECSTVCDVNDASGRPGISPRPRDLPLRTGERMDGLTLMTRRTGMVVSTAILSRAGLVGWVFGRSRQGTLAVQVARRPRAILHGPRG